MLQSPQFEISTNKTDLDVPMIYQFLSEQSTWAVGIPRRVVERAIENSMCFGGFVDGRQVAFARVVTDYATFANLVDVFVLPAYRGNGFAKQMMRTIMAHPSLQGLRRFTLHTSNAHALYREFGFTEAAKPEAYMEKYFPNIYLS
ncbi:N-acetyltransferase [Massilia arenosa]|uniref:N-acetyltransferase n=1 Tax=Zemynaea arenosa TaxID=2561931 RepID=A0A4Y9RN29_9BURK|nr:GNAT family N-acetyltransferase [Massilia arenosa]TFW10687.1 N-acetyltransferase [Massilia arenosa]